MGTLLTSPEGRYVQGDCFDPQTKDQQGNPLTIKTGPNAGQPTQAWIINVAHSKTDPATLPYLLQLRNEAKAAWPAYFANSNDVAPLFGSTHPKFAIKIMDGDGVDDNGKQNALKPGMKGCWIVKYKTSMQAPKVFNKGEYDAMQQVTDRRLLPKGSKVRVRVNVESNKNDTRPGMYLNPNMVEISQVATGADIIVSGEDAGDAFGSGTTIAHSTTPGLTMTGAFTYEALKASGWTDEAMIQAGHAMRPAAAPPPPAASAPPPPAVPAARVMLPAANGSTYEALIGAGWTDDLLVQHAMMAAPAVATPPVPPSPVTPPPASAAPSPPASPPAPPGAAPSPSSYTGFMQPPGKTMLPAAAGHTYESLIAAGWTDAMLVEKGMMAPQ